MFVRLPADTCRQLRGVLRLFAEESLALTAAYFIRSGACIAATETLHVEAMTVDDISRGAASNVEELIPLALDQLFTIELGEELVVFRIVENLLLLAARFGTLRTTKLDAALERLAHRTRLVLHEGGNFGAAGVMARLR